MDDLRNEVGFTDDKKPNAVLYLFLRQALLLAFEAAAREAKRPKVSADLFQSWKRPQPFIHIAAAGDNQVIESESAWSHLYLDFQAVTGTTDSSMAQYIIDNLDKLKEAGDLRELLAALALLVKTPTAALERLLREHLDLCHYRLDAWKMGFLHQQLSYMRFSRNPTTGEQNEPRRGLHLGAYGWVENLKPQAKQLTPAALSGELAAIFNNKPGLPGLMRDSTNGGFIHAPSLNHAVTAAVLRNGYRANATPSAARLDVGQLIVRARPPLRRPDRGNSQRAETRRAARLPFRARPARCRHRPGQIHPRAAQRIFAQRPEAENHADTQHADRIHRGQQRRRRFRADEFLGQEQKQFRPVRASLAGIDAGRTRRGFDRGARALRSRRRRGGRRGGRERSPGGDGQLRARRGHDGRLRRGRSSARARSGAHSAQRPHADSSRRHPIAAGRDGECRRQPAPPGRALLERLVGGPPAGARAISVSW